MVIEGSRPIVDVARECGLNEGTVGNWVRRYRIDHVGGVKARGRSSAVPAPPPSCGWANRGAGSRCRRVIRAQPSSLSEAPPSSQPVDNAAGDTVTAIEYQGPAD